MPPAFKEMGGPTHMMFEELAIRAETDEMDMLAHETGKLMQQCMACHETYRVH
jgi:cytochrome c556